MKGLRHCGQVTRVIDTRDVSGYTRRRRECQVCQMRFSTREIVVLEPEKQRTFKPRFCLDCGARLIESKLIKPLDRICKYCKQARKERQTIRKPPTLTGLPLYLSDALAAGDQPSAGEIARALEVPISTVRDNLRRLAQAGVIEVLRRRGDKSGRWPLRVVGMSGKTEA